MTPRPIRLRRAEDPTQAGIDKVDLALSRFRGYASEPRFAEALDRLLDARLGYMADRDWSRRVLSEIGGTDEA